MTDAHLNKLIAKCWWNSLTPHMASQEVRKTLGCGLDAVDLTEKDIEYLHLNRTK